MLFSGQLIRKRSLDETAKALGVLFLVAMVTGCGAADQPEGPALANDVSSPSLGLTIVGLPPVWTVAVNEGERLELIPLDTGRSGLVRVSVGPEETGVNLVAAVDAHQMMIESSEGGVYSGAQELSGPLGVAFYSRGRYEDEHGSMVEETRIFALHPTASRLLVFDYTYPAADDSSTRVSELIELFALVE